MHVIPVIDLKGGIVVHARRGERAGYRPIETPLADGPDPLAVAAGLLALAPFRRLYVADLDAIAGEGGHDEAIRAIAVAHPELEIWVDRGDADPETLRRRGRAGPGVSVLGTESFPNAAGLRAAIDAADCVLSLDHDVSGPIGPAEIHQDPSFWPRRVIAMTLARVGAGSGPDFDRISDIRARAGGREIYAAGGVRGADDLAALSRIGAAGVLVASALHDGGLTPDDLARVPADRP